MECPSLKLLQARMKELQILIHTSKDKTLFINEYVELLECQSKNLKHPYQEHFIKLRILDNQWKQSGQSIEEASTFLLQLESLRNEYEKLKPNEFEDILLNQIKTKNHDYTDLIYDYCETIR